MSEELKPCPFCGSEAFGDETLGTIGDLAQGLLFGFDDASKEFLRYEGVRKVPVCES